MFTKIMKFIFKNKLRISSHISKRKENR